MALSSHALLEKEIGTNNRELEGYLLKEVKSSHLALINLNDFLALTRVEGDAVEDRADHIINKLGGFDKNKAGALSLVIRKCNSRLKVSNHEGRARAMAALKSGITEYL